MQRLLSSDIRTTQNNTELFFCTNLTNLTNGFSVRNTRNYFYTDCFFNEHGKAQRFTEALLYTDCFILTNTEGHGCRFVLYESHEWHGCSLCTEHTGTTETLSTRITLF